MYFLASTRLFVVFSTPFSLKLNFVFDAVAKLSLCFRYFVSVWNLNLKQEVCNYYNQKLSQCFAKKIFFCGNMSGDWTGHYTRATVATFPPTRHKIIEVAPVVDVIINIFSSCWSNNSRRDDCIKNFLLRKNHQL